MPYNHGSPTTDVVPHTQLFRGAKQLGGLFFRESGLFQ